MGFEDKYNKIISVVSEELTTLKTMLNQELRELNSGVGKFDTLMTNYVGAKSKHIRSVLTFLYLKARGIEVDEKQIIFQVIIELIHNASLIHDDVIDGSLTRRNDKSLNANLGNHLSVTGGDFLLSYVLKFIVKLKSFEIVSLLSKTLEKMCKGEIKQYYSKYQIPTIDEYLDKTYAKTGALFNLALSGSEILACKEVSDVTENFAKNFGIAFQIRDDIKNVTTACPDNDIENGIYTAPVIYSGDITNPVAGLAKAKILLDNYVREAEMCLKNLKDSKYKKALVELLELVNNE